MTGTHGGPKKKPQRKSTGKLPRSVRGSRAAERGRPKSTKKTKGSSSKRSTRAKRAGA